MAKDFSNQKVVDGYDDHIRKLIPGYELIHQNVHAILKQYLSENAHIVVVGCGTGYELQYLSETFPQWKFTAIDPSKTMIEKAKALCNQHNAQHKIEFIHADSQILKQYPAKFDAALSILVSHFVDFQSKAQFFSDIAQSLKNQGILLSYDLMKIHDQNEINILKNLVQEIGLTVQQSENMAQRLVDDFYLISTEELQKLFNKAGFSSVQSFMQVLNYYGWIAKK
ncbi:class I SAM-dependent methyltransferase [Acinetobacter gerneri]|uniref:class I SAM-dependent methyltransferase n=1 Tax=Acinetobacter gerneri TaxID=202952 RepID=UPI0028B0BD60|nr:L-histidine N(alpha)-methyltransferase [Acinetobacter gerneri]